MVADWRGPASCWLAVSPLLRRAAEVGRPVRVSGEMVSVFWDAGLVDAAIEVEGYGMSWAVSTCSHCCASTRLGW